MLLMDKLSYASSLRKLSPELKAYLSLGTLLLCVITQSILIGAISFSVMGGLTLFWSKTPFRYYLKAFCVPFVFIILTTIAIFLEFSIQPVGDIQVKIFGIYLCLFFSSIEKGIQIFVTVMGAVSCMYFLSFTTPMTDFFIMLQKLRISKVLIELMLLIYRFIFLIFDIVGAIHLAQVCRLGNKDFKTSLSSMGQMLAATFVRSLRKSESLYLSMEARGYDGELRVLMPEFEFKRTVLLGVIIFHSCLFILGILF